MQNSYDDLTKLSAIFASFHNNVSLLLSLTVCLDKCLCCTAVSVVSVIKAPLGNERDIDGVVLVARRMQTPGGRRCNCSVVDQS